MRSNIIFYFMQRSQTLFILVTLYLHHTYQQQPATAAAVAALLYMTNIDWDDYWVLSTTLVDSSVQSAKAWELLCSELSRDGVSTAGGQPELYSLYAARSTTALPVSNTAQQQLNQAQVDSDGLLLFLASFWAFKAAASAAFFSEDDLQLLEASLYRTFKLRSEVALSSQSLKWWRRPTLAPQVRQIFSKVKSHFLSTLDSVVTAKNWIFSFIHSFLDATKMVFSQSVIHT